MSRLARLLGFVFKDEERIDRWVRLYIHHRNLYAKGHGELGFIRGLVNGQSLMVMWLFLKNIIPDLPFWLFVACVPVGLALKWGSGWFLGYWWDRHSVYDKESDWTNSRNPVLNGLDKKVLQGEGKKAYRLMDYGRGV